MSQSYTFSNKTLNGKFKIFYMVNIQILNISFIDIENWYEDRLAFVQDYKKNPE